MVASREHVIGFGELVSPSYCSFKKDDIACHPNRRGRAENGGIKSMTLNLDIHTESRPGAGLWAERMRCIGFVVASCKVLLL